MSLSSTVTSLYTTSWRNAVSRKGRSLVVSFFIHTASCTHTHTQYTFFFKLSGQWISKTARTMFGKNQAVRSLVSKIHTHIHTEERQVVRCLVTILTQRCCGLMAVIYVSVGDDCSKKKLTGTHSKGIGKHVSMVKFLVSGCKSIPHTDSGELLRRSRTLASYCCWCIVFQTPATNILREL